MELIDNRLSTEKEFTQGLFRQVLTDDCPSSGVPLYYTDEAVYTDNSDSHTLIFGNTGSKKTRNFCIPSVYTIGMAGESMIISDPKGEIYHNTSNFLHSKGYDVKVFNLRDPEKSFKWNPLLLPYRYFKNGDEDKAIEMVSDLCMQLKAPVHSDRDVYWENQAMSLLIGLILILFECEDDESKIHMESVQRIRMYIQMENKEDTESCIFWDLVRSFPKGSIVRYYLTPIYSLRKVEKTLECVANVLDGMTRTFIFNQSIMNLTNDSEISFSDIGNTKTALYLITPDEKRTFHFFVSIFVKQCYETLIDLAHTQKDGKLQNRVNFILDEFSNFPKIADMPSMISASRSRNIRFLLVVQSKQQLLSEYGEEAETIKSNCKNWIYISCRELSLLKEIQELCGTVEVDGRQIPLLNITQLQRLPIGWEDSQVLVLRSGVLPYISWVKDFSVYPQANQGELKIPYMKFKKAKCFSVIRYVCKALKNDLANKEEDYKLDW